MSVIDLSSLLWHVVAVVGVLAFVALAVFWIVREVRFQVKAYRIMHRPKRAPGYVYDRDNERLPL